MGRGLLDAHLDSLDTTQIPNFATEATADNVAAIRFNAPVNAGANVSARSRATLLYRYGSSNSPRSYFARSTRRTALSITARLGGERFTPIGRLVDERAIVNAMVGADTMKGFNGNTVFALPHDRLREVLKKYNRLQ